MTNPNTDIITRCPQCQTSFKATSSILSAANGTVRCGSCLRVFDAYEHQLNKPKATTEPAKDTLTGEDESWALKLLEEEEHHKKAEPAEPEESTSTEQPKIDPLRILAEIRESFNTEDTTTHKTNNADIDTLDETLAPTQKEEPSIIIEPTLPDDADDIDDSNLLLERIELDPLELEESHKSSSWGWLVGAFLLSITLLAQGAWWRFDTLSAQAPYRPYYQLACNYLPCELKPMVNTDLIKTSQLIIRSHPSETNALLVDAIIINKARFAQAYPNLRLTFLDINNQAVASRSFQPHEYLKGELTNATLMDINQPIQLSLAIVDPGKDAVNYIMDATEAQEKK